MSGDPDPNEPAIALPGRDLIDVQVTIDDPAWQDLVPGLEVLVDRIARIALGHEAIKFAWQGASELSVLLTRDRHVHTLNSEYRGRDAATNVLSFAYGNGPGNVTGCLGDVVLARETIEREAREQGKTIRDHLSHLLVHGVLHLCGLDHETDNQAEHMERLEGEILALSGVSDPYGSTRTADPGGDPEEPLDPAHRRTT